MVKRAYFSALINLTYETPELAKRKLDSLYVKIINEAGWYKWFSARIDNKDDRRIQIMFRMNNRFCRLDCEAILKLFTPKPNSGIIKYEPKILDIHRTCERLLRKHKIYIRLLEFMSLSMEKSIREKYHNENDIRHIVNKIYLSGWNWLNYYRAAADEYLIYRIADKDLDYHIFDVDNIKYVIIPPRDYFPPFSICRHLPIFDPVGCLSQYSRFHTVEEFLFDFLQKKINEGDLGAKLLRKKFFNK